MKRERERETMNAKRTGSFIVLGYDVVHNGAEGNAVSNEITAYCAEPQKKQPNPCFETGKLTHGG